MSGAQNIMRYKPAAWPERKRCGMIKYVLFDLDGTLLNTDRECFKARFFELLGESELIKKLGSMEVFLVAFKKIHHGDGQVSNYKLFCDTVAKEHGVSESSFKEELNEFFEKDFLGMKTVFGEPSEEMRLAVDLLKEKGYILALATGPVFPRCAIEMRLNMAGFSADEFCLITSWETTGYYKYDTNYYIEIAEKLKAEPSECLMVGNSVAEDAVAMEAGMKCYLLNDRLIGTLNGECESGSAADFLAYAREMPCICDRD